MKNNYFTIFNPEQADFFVKHGLPVLEIGTRKLKEKDGKIQVYIRFNRDTIAEQVFNLWCNRNLLKGYEG